ncbi:MAG TPA: class I SAM-dependent methyltransferase, partial [Thermomicrobiales bacterium]|nr:class I SAM-dependent methyltransferase [Thermomicrobiales bacterium]
EAWRQMRAQDGAVFAAATERMLDLAGIGTGDRILDVAAGTGEQTLAAAWRVGPTGSVLATDISASMLAVAADVLRQEGWSNVETLVADAQRLDLPPDSFDAAISRFGVMLISVHQEALAAIRRALKPGGKLAAMVWSTAERNPFFALPLGILQARDLLPPPEPGQPEAGPFALGTPDAFEAEFRQAGFRDVAIESVAIRWRFPSVAATLDYYRLNVATLRRETADRLAGAAGEHVFAEIELALDRFRGPNGLEVPGEALIGVGAK